MESQPSLNNTLTTRPFIKVQPLIFDITTRDDRIVEAMQLSIHFHCLMSPLCLIFVDALSYLSIFSRLEQTMLAAEVQTTPPRN